MRAIIVLSLLLTAAAGATSSTNDAEPERPYIFGWPFVDQASLQPRGGTSRGPEVTLDTETSEAFERIHAPNLSDVERDRRAILTMAGPYRVSFDFLEIAGYRPDFSPARPYRSWATEYVYVIANERDFISLQHLLVMSIVDDDGKSHGPFVTKHWRQDWHYRADKVHRYRGANTWERQNVPDRPGLWTQTVWQVDDSPRYAAWGEWRHEAEYSTWRSNETWRPLPRREYSARADYDVLIGHNHHTVLPGGWLQEEHNDKVVLDEPGVDGKRLAREYGIARYERIKGYDFSPGDAYLKATAPFWSEVREYWNRLLDKHDRIQLKAQVDQAGLFRPLFVRAQAIADGDAYNPKADSAFIKRTINGFLAESAQRDGGY